MWTEVVGCRSSFEHDLANALLANVDQPEPGHLQQGEKGEHQPLAPQRWLDLSDGKEQEREASSQGHLAARFADLDRRTQPTASGIGS